MKAFAATWILLARTNEGSIKFKCECDQLTITNLLIEPISWTIDQHLWCNSSCILQLWILKKSPSTYFSRTPGSLVNHA